MVTLLCCCLLSSAWALVSLRGPGAPPVPLLALNVVPPARSGLGVLPTHVPLCRAAGQEGRASPLSPLLLKSFPAAMEALQRDGFSISRTHRGQGSVPRRSRGNGAGSL